jgi:hypothetical protein
MIFAIRPLLAGSRGARWHGSGASLSHLGLRKKLPDGWNIFANFFGSMNYHTCRGPKECSGMGSRKTS